VSDVTWPPLSTEGRFHSGELQVQRRAGVAGQAARLEGMLAPAQLSDGMSHFLARRHFAVLAARDVTGRLWASPLLGPDGFLTADRRTVAIRPVGVAASDPLRRPPSGQSVGLIVIEFALRRRVRINGVLTAAQPDRFTLAVQEAFGNCPSYIQRRDLRLVQPHDSVEPAPPGRGDGSAGPLRMTAEQRRLVGAADTFFLATAHPERGADASHKGGRSGFVRVDGDELWWPDYPGNNMFNSLGNIAVNPEAAVLFLDFDTGSALHLSGTARLDWTELAVPGDDGVTGRRVRFRPDRGVVTRGLPLRAGGALPSPHNPELG
jgi:predicted pyridoxine 5'-phosphate oxidase superfamily flavin-nucleotide-binding protein